MHETGLLNRCTTAYVGGGTPTLLSAYDLGSLAQTVRATAPHITEFSCEANPDSLDADTLEALCQAGVTRLSVGVQSLNNDELRELGRAHDVATACERVAAAVAAGLDVSVDLMCATPLQTDQSWEASVRGVVELGVGHVSVYPLAIEEGTPLAVRVGDDDPAWNDPDVQAERMEMAARILGEAGFSRYEVASYAREGKQCRHNEAYWTVLPYLGLGTGAASMLDLHGYGRLRACCTQLPDLPENIMRVRLAVTSDREAIARAPALDALCFDLELLDEAQAVAEDLMLGMRLTRGIGRGLVEHARCCLGREAVDAALAELAHRGLACWRDHRFVPTKQGWLLGNQLYGTLWDLSPSSPRTLRC